MNTPPVVSRTEWLAAIDTLRAQEKAHTREGDAIAAARRRLPMTEVDPSTPLVGGAGAVPLIDVFEGRTQLFVSYHMWHDGHPAADQCEGCTFFTGQVRELSYLHQRDVTFAVFCQGPYEESDRYRRLMGWELPWYSVPAQSHERLLAGRHFGMKASYLRDRDGVYETYWTTGRGVEPMAPSYGILDMTVHGRQETWEDSTPGWPQPYETLGQQFRKDGRPTAQWADHRRTRRRPPQRAAQHGRLRLLLLKPGPQAAAQPDPRTAVLWTCAPTAPQTSVGRRMQPLRCRPHAVRRS